MDIPEPIVVDDFLKELGIPAEETVPVTEAPKTASQSEVQQSQATKETSPPNSSSVSQPGVAARRIKQLSELIGKSQQANPTRQVNPGTTGSRRVLSLDEIRGRGGAANPPRQVNSGNVSPRRVLSLDELRAVRNQSGTHFGVLERNSVSNQAHTLASMLRQIRASCR